MVGITSYGAYIPIYRLSRRDIAQAWRSSARGGEKAVANFDEDSITMAVAAGLDSLAGIGKDQIDGLYLASTTMPYDEKQGAALVAEVLDVPRQADTVDFSNSLRSATTALRSAIASVKSGTAHKIMVTSSDCRLGIPKSDLEQTTGDGAAALVIGDSDVIAEVEFTSTHHDEFLDMWRQSGDRFLKSGEDRFIITQGYVRNVKEAVSRTMDSLNMSAKDVNKLVLYTPDSRSHVPLARELGFDPKIQLQDTMVDSVGNTGSAAVSLMLIGALEDANPGDRILVVAYGDGCDTLVLRVNENIRNLPPRRGLKGHLASKMMLRSYQDYLAFSDLLPAEPMRRSPPTSSLPAKWRSRRSLLSLYGGKCRSCGTVQFPLQRVCHICRTKDDFEEVPLSRLRGKIFTYTKDYMAPSGELPAIMSVLDLDNGCRFFCQMTDRDPDEVDLDMEVELTFRRVFDYGDYANYYWKCRPVR